MRHGRRGGPRAARFACRGPGPPTPPTVHPSAPARDPSMPPGLARIEPTLPQAHHAISVTENGQHLGIVALVLVQRPHGATLRRQWWAQPPANDPRPIPRPFDTRAGAISCLRYRHATLHRPEPGPAPDATLAVIAAALANAGPTAAVWLAASLALHHIAELEAQRRSDPPAVWRELRRIGDWLKAATDPNPYGSSVGGVDYRRTEPGWCNPREGSDRRRQCSDRALRAAQSAHRRRCDAS